MENCISVTIPPDVTKAVLTIFVEIENLLRPYAADIPAAEKNALLKLGDKTIPFVEKTVGYTKTATEFSPSYLDGAELKRDNDALKALDQMYRPAVQVLKMIEDTRSLVGNDAYAASLVYYQAVKQA